MLSILPWDENRQWLRTYTVLGLLLFGGEMPVATNPSIEDLKRARARALEWKEFRRTFLYSQRHLAAALQCSRRTVSAVENGRESIHPHVELLRRFRDLKRRHEKAERAVA
jgi:DNA-binding XRE family transcriptional regulator